LDYFELSLQPGLASDNLPDQRFLVQAPLAALNPSEVFHGIGNINVLARYTRFAERFVQHSTRRSNERMPLAIFHVARLFAYQHEIRVFCTFAENGMGRVLVKIAPFAGARSGAHALERAPLGQKLFSR